MINKISSKIKGILARISWWAPYGLRNDPESTIRLLVWSQIVCIWIVISSSGSKMFTRSVFNDRADAFFESVLIKFPFFQFLKIFIFFFWNRVEIMNLCRYVKYHKMYFKQFYYIFSFQQTRHPMFQNGLWWNLSLPLVAVKFNFGNSF